MSAESRLAQVLALNRTMAIVLVTVLLFGLGEELWRPFVPVYLKAQSKELTRQAHITGEVETRALWLVGVFACLLNLFEGFCYIGGGQLTARLGDRGSLIFFGLLTLAGYLLFLLVPLPGIAVVASLLILGWEPLSVPVTFTTVGATVAKEKRGMAFALQSIQKRLPKILGPAIAGWVLDFFVSRSATPEAGEVLGMQALVAGALVLGLCSLGVQFFWMPHRKAPMAGPSLGTIWRELPPTLRRLLTAEIFTRWCDWLIRDFVVLYVVFVQKESFTTAGLLMTLQNITALLTYLPVGRMTEAVGLQPFIGVTFLFFALFPLVLALVPGGPWLMLAFVVNGLREIGEPARKALITSLFPEEVRARGVGLYWGLRSFAICWASLVGAFLWQQIGPVGLLYTAFALGCVGAGIFYFWVAPRITSLGNPS